MEVTDKLDRYLAAREQEHRFSGVVLITQGGAHIFAAAYGYASRAWGI